MSNSAKRLGVLKTIRPLSQPTKNYTNAKFHSAVDIAKVFSGLVDTHFQASQFQNHVLSSVSRSYLNPNGLRSKSQTNFRKSVSKNNKPTNQKISSINPQNNGGQNSKITTSLIFQENQIIQDRTSFIKLKNGLSGRAERVPQYSKSLNQGLDLKRNLQDCVAELKRLIMDQKKMKTKISLNCNKIMNQRQLTHANTCKKERENYHLQVKIAAESEECHDQEQEVELTRRKIEQQQQNVIQQRQLRNKVKKYVQETRIILRNEQRDVAQMKEWVSSSYNRMNNNYQQMNQRQQEQALLLAEIDTNFVRHG